MLFCIKKIATYLNFPLNNRKIKKISLELFDTSSPTFHKGLIGNWKNKYKSNILSVFNQKFGKDLEGLGYDYE